MKILITELQFKKLINEIGGYDDKNIMGSHSSFIHRTLGSNVENLVNFLKDTILELMTGNLGKIDISIKLNGLVEKLTEIIVLIDPIIDEIYLDDDYKTIVLNFNNGLKQVVKKLNSLKHISTEMSNKKTIYNILLFLHKLESYLIKLSEMINTIIPYRFIKRLGGDNN